MVIKRKTTTRIAAPKAFSKVIKDTVESEEAEEVVSRKTMKKPAAAALMKKMDLGKKRKEASEESEEEESEDESEAAKTTTKTMKKPAAAGAKGQKKVEAEDSDTEEEDEEEEESEEDEESSEEDLQQIVAVESKVMKKPAAAAKTTKMQVEQEEDEDSSEEEEEEEKESESAEEDEENQADANLAARSKELKSMAVDDLRELLMGHALKTEKMKKEDMIKAMLEHEARIRTAVVKKKEQVESQSVSELNKTCKAMDIEGGRSREERIGLILKKWQEDGGVEEALAAMKHLARYKDLDSMDTVALRAICEHNNVDPFVQEVIADRISMLEDAAGQYARPQIETEAAEADNGHDMVDAILASETTRKDKKRKEMEQASAVGAQFKELKAMSIEELKKRLAKKGLESDGKKESMIQALFTHGAEEAAIAAKKSELKSMEAQELRTLCKSKGLLWSSKSEMIVSILAHDAMLRKNLRAFDAKAQDVIAKKKEELQTESNPDLKELCSEKGLAVGGGKEERIARLIEQFAETGGEVDAAVTEMIREHRKEELLRMDKALLASLCERAGGDPCVKKVMIERVLTHEEEVGPAEQPPTKKARKTK